MIDRYTLPEMQKIWSEEEKIKKWLLVEITVCEALYKFGIMPKEDFEKIKKNVKLDINRIKELERITKHDLAAFVDQICETIPSKQASKWIHFGLTSSDVLDTATALQLKESCELIVKKLELLKNTVKKLSLKYKNTIMIGRTHGIHAEPITFGFKLLGWLSEIIRHTDLIKSTKEYVSYGKISGAVGTYAHINPEIEEYVCKKLGLYPEPVSTQIVPRDRYAVYLCRLAIVAGAIERISVELRNLQRSEIGEVEEGFTKGQKGSSAMPHKKNPITSEQLTGLSRVVRSNCIAGLENIALWHERDISHSSVERVILPDSSILVDYMITKLNTLLENLVVYPENMFLNIEKSYDVYFSQPLLLTLIKKGMTRQEAYSIVQSLSHKALKEKKKFKDIVLQDKTVQQHLSQEEIKKIFTISYFTKNIGKIYKRLNL